MSIELRTLSADEMALHRDVRLRALRDSPGSFGESFADAAARPPSYWEQLTHSVAAPSRQVMLLAHEDDTVVGSTYGLLDPVRTDAGRVGGMWVEPAWRRRGVGRALVEEVRRWARAQGLKRLGLWAPAASPAALALYSRAGFLDTGLRQQHPLDPSLTLMEMVTKL